MKMGCNISTTNAGRDKTDSNGSSTLKLKFDESKRGSITPEERNIVSKTWPHMTTDMPGNGLQVFLRIFEIRPDAKKLFNIENVRHADVARNAIIKGHGSRFLQAIGAAVDRLNDLQLNNKDDLDNLLIHLGNQHKRYSGFKPEYFDVFYEALMWQWERNMGTEFTPEVASAWSHVFVYVMMRLKEGYLNPAPNDDGGVRSNTQTYSIEIEGI